MKKNALLALAVVALMFGPVSSAQGAAILTNAAFNANAFAANDDGSTGPIPFGFSLNFYGQNYSTFFLNNNGNITFTMADGTYTPSGITAGSLARLAPFWGDVDTRGASNLTRYGTSTVDGHAALGVNWIDVGYFPSSPGPNRNSFQLVVIDRSDTGAGNFDFMFNYDRIQWEAGTASNSDANGCGGESAHVGWTNGAGTFFEFPGSGVDGAFIDSGICPHNAAGPNVLITHSLNSNVAGQYVFSVRGGVVVPHDSGEVPEPASLVLLGTGIAIVAVQVRRRRRK